MGFQEDVRSGTLTALAAYRDAVTLPLQIYGGRPRTINPPTVFVDTMRETIVYSGHVMQRTVQIDIIFCHGTFDDADAAHSKDVFADGFIEQVRDNTFAYAGANSTIGVVSTEDDPTFVPDWLPRSEQRTYYATRMTLEGYQGD